MRNYGILFFIIALIIALFLFVGCDPTATLNNNQEETSKVEFLPLNEKTDGYRFIIVTDPDTGVQYIFYSAGYQSALTVRLNADGTPVTVPMDKEK